VLELIAAAVGPARDVWGIEAFKHHAFLPLRLKMTEQARFVGGIGGNLCKLNVRDVRPVEQAGEFNDPALIRLGPKILPIPFQQIEGIQHVSHALPVQDEVTGDLVGANDNG